MVCLCGVKRTKNQLYRSTGRSYLTDSNGTVIGMEKTGPVPSLVQDVEEAMLRIIETPDNSTNVVFQTNADLANRVYGVGS